MGFLLQFYRAIVVLFQAFPGSRGDQPHHPQLCIKQNTWILTTEAILDLDACS